MEKPFLIVLLIIVVTGCSSPPAGGPYLLTQSPNVTSIQHSERLIALDKSAASALSFVNHQQIHLESGQLRLLINLQNISTTHDIWMDWKVVFYDSQNFEIETTEWNKSFFPAKEIKTLKANSIRRDAINYTVMLRSPSSEKGVKYDINNKDVR